MKWGPLLMPQEDYKAYPCFILRIKTISARINVIEFASNTGKSMVSRPYSAHNKIPVVRITYINREISLVFFVFAILITCGRKEIVVQVAASRPMIIIQFIKTN